VLYKPVHSGKYRELTMIDTALFHHPTRGDASISEVTAAPRHSFKGREDICECFQCVLADAWGTNGDSMFLILGVSGAGKSALMHQMLKDADWALAHIGVVELWDPAAMVQNWESPTPPAATCRRVNAKII